MAREDSAVVVRLLTTFSMSASCTELGTFVVPMRTALLLARNEIFSFLFFFLFLPSSLKAEGGGVQFPTQAVHDAAAVCPVAFPYLPARE